MPPGSIHPANPEHPKGMAWVLAAGFPDPRGDTYPNQQLVLVQGWDFWSEQAWDLGIRWHPELQTKWVTGGGQFAPGTLTNEKPEKAETLEEQAEEVLDMIAEEKPEFVAALRAIRAEGSDSEKKKAAGELQKNVIDMMKLAEYVNGGQPK